ncbi:hypothetical protein CcaCcLH18_01281 [Colletotrichum camelliae]|nr:hypothetical protein CcaCcLH18_01281 [Colletotrichum camelliae]
MERSEERVEVDKKRFPTPGSAVRELALSWPMYQAWMRTPGRVLAPGWPVAAQDGWGVHPFSRKQARRLSASGGGGGGGGAAGAAENASSGREGRGVQHKVVFKSALHRI